MPSPAAFGETGNAQRLVRTLVFSRCKEQPERRMSPSMSQVSAGFPRCSDVQPAGGAELESRAAYRRGWGASDPSHPQPPNFTDKEGPSAGTSSLSEVGQSRALCSDPASLQNWAVF